MCKKYYVENVAYSDVATTEGLANNWSDTKTLDKQITGESMARGVTAVCFTFGQTPHSCLFCNSSLTVLHPQHHIYLTFSHLYQMFAIFLSQYMATESY